MTNGVIIGLDNASGTLTNNPGSSGDPSVGFWNNGGQWLGGTASGSNTSQVNDGDIECFLVDVDAKKISAGLNGGTMTAVCDFSGFAGPYFIVAAFSSGPGQDIIASWRSEHFRYTPPSGAMAWDISTLANTYVRRRPSLVIAS